MTERSEEMRPVFSVDELNRRFDRDGFVVVPLLSDEAAEALETAYSQLGPAPDDPRVSIFFDFQSSSAAYKRATVDAMRPIFETATEGLLDRCHIYYTNFIMKWPGDQSGFGPHMDSSFVDERTHRSFSIWCPLADTTGAEGIDNGLLHVVPGSHRFIRSVRSHQPRSFPYAGCEREIVEQYGVPLAVARGQAVVFDHRLLHFSMPNTTAEPRLVAVAGVHPDEAEVFHYREEAQDQFDIYRVDDQFFIDFNPFSLAEGAPAGYELVDRVTHDTEFVSSERLRELCSAAAAARGEDRPLAARDVAATYRDSLELFCFRCGERQEAGARPGRANGNLTLLCESCGAIEQIRGVGPPSEEASGRGLLPRLLRRRRRPPPA